MPKKYKELVISKELFTSVYKVDEKKLIKVYTSRSEYAGERLHVVLKDIEESEEVIQDYYLQDFIQILKISSYERDMMITSKFDISGYAVMFRYVGKTENIASFYGSTENEALLNGFESFWGQR